MNELPINPTDLAVAALLLVSGLLAFVRGFVKEILSVAGWIGAAIATLQFFPVARPYVRRYVEPTFLADALTGAAIFIATLVVLSLISHFLARRVRESSVSALDRSLGFLFGLVRGAVVVAIAYVLLALAVPPAEQPDWIRQARVVPLAEQWGRWLLLALPAETRDDIEEKLGSDASLLDESADLVRKIPKIRIINRPQSAPDSPPEKGYNATVREGLERLLRARPDE